MKTEEEILREQLNSALSALELALQIGLNLQLRIDKAIALVEGGVPIRYPEQIVRFADNLLAILRGEGESDVRAPELQDEEGVEGGAGGG